MTKAPAVKVNGSDWDAGYDAGFHRRAMIQPAGVDDLSWLSGFVEGRGDRQVGKPHVKERLSPKP